MLRKPRYVDANFAPLYLNSAACEQIKRMPTAQDVVKVIRCKDCKYLKYDRDFITGRYCSLRNVNGGKYCKDDDFCSYGKRKENGIDDE